MRIKGEPDLKILQTNLNHCRTAHDLLLLNAHNMEVDIVVVSEPYTTPVNWFTDTTGRAAIYVTGKGIRNSKQLTLVKSDKGFVIIKYNGYLIVSVYVSPNINQQEFETYLTYVAGKNPEVPETKKKIDYYGGF